jgi:hypothetical protein
MKYAPVPLLCGAGFSAFYFLNSFAPPRIAKVLAMIAPKLY